MDEFVRLQTLLRIEEETERTDRIKVEREFLVEQVNYRSARPSQPSQQRRVFLATRKSVA